MDFLTRSSYQYGGNGSIYTSWLFIAIIFWILGIILWNIYYFGFTDKNNYKFGYVKDNEHAIRGTQTAIFLFVTGLAVLLAFTGKWQNQVNEKSDLRSYVIIPLCWLTLGFQVSLIAVITSIEV
jgi:hypothetical protein